MDDSLKKDHGLEGEWITRDSLFLFQPPPHVSTIRIAAATGALIGFNAEAIAAQLKITAGDVFLSNRSGTLSIQQTPGTPDAGADEAIVYLIMLHGIGAAYTKLNLTRPKGVT